MASPRIHEISSIELDSGVTGSFGIDEDGTLYWNGNAVVMKQKITLAIWVDISVVVTAVSTLVIAVFTALLYLCPR